MNVKMLFLFLLHAMFLAAPLRAQIISPNEEFEKQYRPTLTQQGRLMALQAFPANDKVDVYLTGKEPNQYFRTNDVDFKAYIRNAEELTPISSSAQGDFFTIDVDPARHPDLGIEVRYKGDVENFNLNLQPAAPAVQPKSSPQRE